jgi:hypothetical protein
LGLPIPFQAEYEGSIPFTRSKLFKDALILSAPAEPLSRALRFRAPLRSQSQPARRPQNVVRIALPGAPQGRRQMRQSIGVEL